MDLKKVLENRHSTRRFKKSKPVKFKEIIEVMDAARYAPSAGGLFTLKLILVDDDDLKSKVADACLGQSFIAEAPYVIVVCSEMDQIKRSYGKRADIYARQQAGAAIENMLLKITDLGLASCWIGAFEDNMIKRILKIPETANVEAILPVGYAFGKEEIKDKIELRRVVRFNDWNTSYKPSYWEPVATGNE